MGDAFAAAATVAKGRRPITPFDRSMRQKSFHGGRLEDTIKVAPFLEASLRMMKEFVSALIRDGSVHHVSSISSFLPTCSQVQQTTFKALAGLREFWWDLFRLATLPTIDNASYHVHIQLGWQAIENENVDDASSSALITTQRTLIQELSVGTSLTTGLHMERLWRSFRPRLVPSTNRISGYEQLKALADRFDVSIFPLRAPLDELARTREYLQFALRASLVEDVELEGLLAEVSKAITVLGETDDSISREAIFKTQFEAIYQQLRSVQVSSTKSQLALLSGRSSANEQDLIRQTAQDTPVQESLAQLSYFAFDAMTQIAPSAIAGGLSSSLLQRLDSIESVPLSELEQLRTELQVVGKIVAQQAHTLCDDQLHHIARALQEQLGACEDAGLHELGLADPVAGKEELGRKLLKYAAVMLLAYVPDRAFDPALKEQIQRQLIIARRGAQEGKLKALQNFEEFFSGRSESMRIGLARDDLSGIGEDRPELQIARPERSQLNQLQGDFNRIIEIVRGLEDFSKGDKNPVDANLMQNIALLAKRLAENYLAYRDVVVPVVQWLQCLWLGLAILQHDSSPTVDSSPESSPLSLIHAVATA